MRASVGVKSSALGADLDTLMFIDTKCYRRSRRAKSALHLFYYTYIGAHHPPLESRSRGTSDQLTLRAVTKFFQRLLFFFTFPRRGLWQ